MELAEIEGLVAELESRLDRLRSLYDQYFMGIEKLEPNVPRKDIDRRIFVLRKVQIRNTGIRFRFQMILQRYNTYQTYWQRICRKIDDGTYKRHMLRAEARFGDGVGGAQRRTKAPSAAPPPPSQTTPAADDTSWLDEDFPEPALPRIAPPPVAGVSLPAPPPASASFPAAAPITSKWRKAPPAEARLASPPPPLVAPPATPPAPPPLPKPPPPLPAAANLSKAPAAPVAASTPARPLPAPSRFTRPPVPTAAIPPKPATPAPPRPPAPAPQAAAPVAQRPPAAAASELPDDRVRQIYAQYVDTKRKQNESTAAITFDALAKSLRESSAKLREKHGRSIDFEVAVKDGKTILKPVVK